MAVKGSPAEGVMAKRRKSVEANFKEWQAANPLRLWREAQPPEGWTRAVLARQLGVSHPSVGSWEDGTKLPLVDAAAKIEKLTGISATDWMDWYEKKPEEASA